MSKTQPAGPTAILEGEFERLPILQLPGFRSTFEHIQESVALVCDSRRTYLLLQIGLKKRHAELTFIAFKVHVDPVGRCSYRLGRADLCSPV